MKRCLDQKNYEKNAALIRETFGDLTGARILEIGAGYGGIARFLLDNNKIERYTIIEHPAMIRLACWHLRWCSPVVYVDVTLSIDYSKFEDYDLLISTFCISETPPEFQRKVMDHLFPKCAAMFIVDMDPMGEIAHAMAMQGRTLDILPYFKRKGVNLFILHPDQERLCG